MSSVRLMLGDCLDVMPTLEANSVDAIICDPPYGLSFMGKHWDHGVPGVAFWEAALRVAKPGAYLLAFGGSRTFHRLATAIEDAGWELKDVLSWLHGQGFPKGKNQLKPAWEPIIMARKPLVGTVAENVLAWGVGRINVDASRIGIDGTDDIHQKHAKSNRTGQNTCFSGLGEHSCQVPQGRWPSNVLLDEEAARLLDEASGPSGGHSAPTKGNANTFGGGWSERSVAFHADTGGASRFFKTIQHDKDDAPSRFAYIPKASKRDRDEGLEGMPLRARGQKYNLNTGGDLPQQTPHKHEPQRNHHPTVKPTQLMRYLCRLVTPPNGVILDPFCGSGSTGKGAVLEGFNFVGIELDAEYLEIAEKRISHAQAQPVAQAQPALFEVTA